MHIHLIICICIICSLIITNVGLILTKLRFLLSGYGQTRFQNRHENMSTHQTFHVRAQNLELAVDPSMHPKMTGIHNLGNLNLKKCCHSSEKPGGQKDFYFSTIETRYEYD